MIISTSPGVGAVAYAGPPGRGEGQRDGGADGGEPRRRGLRVQGMPWRRWLTDHARAVCGAPPPSSSSVSSCSRSVTTAATEARSRAAGAVATTSAPELVTAENLYGNLADADATASTIFLRAGQEPRRLRRRYLADVAARGPSTRRRLAFGGIVADRPPCGADHLGASARVRGAGGVGAREQRAGLPGRRRVPAEGVGDDARRDPSRGHRPLPRRGPPAPRPLRGGHVDAHARRSCSSPVSACSRCSSSCRSSCGGGRTGSSTSGWSAATVLVVGLLGWTLVRFARRPRRAEPGPGTRLRLGRGALVGAHPDAAAPRTTRTSR